jgi:hypothetical protein
MRSTTWDTKNTTEKTRAASAYTSMLELGTSSVRPRNNRKSNSFTSQPP